MAEVDYIIVGQGLAGSVLAFTLMEHQQKVLVVDEEKECTSSKVAAGICNPVVFKRLTKSWLVDEALPFAKKFYRHQEELLEQQFYVDMPIYKLFANEEEQKFWRQKSNEPHLLDWISDKVEYPFNKEQVDYLFGASKTLQSGCLNTADWLASFRNYLIENDAYINQQFNYAKIGFDKDTVSWNGVKAKKIIFCEGYQCTNNPYFSWLPFKLTKGEVLTINFENLELKEVINKAVFILPWGKNYKLGATYNWEQLDDNITEEAKNELLEKAKKFIDDPITVINHQSAVRPTVSDRRPLLGLHPSHNQLAVFNGLGTKGVMLAPYFAQKMTNFLLQNQALPQEVNINRFI